MNLCTTKERNTAGYNRVSLYKSEKNNDYNQNKLKKSLTQSSQTNPRNTYRHAGPVGSAPLGNLFFLENSSASSV